MRLLSVSLILCCSSLLADSTVASANPVTLFSTSYEAPTYSAGPLSGQDGWVNSFDIDPLVSSVQPKTGTQALEVRKSAGDNGFGLTFRNGPYPSSLPQVVVQHSIFLPGNTGWEGSFLSPMALIGENGFIGQVAIRNGSVAELFVDNVGGSTPVQADSWIDLQLVLDFPTQTQEAFVNGVSIGWTAFDNPSTRLDQVETFHIIGTDDNPFYVDDLSITAIPEPSSLALIACAGAFVLRRRR